MGTKIVIGLVLALVLAGGLVLAALAPGVGLIILLAIVVLVAIVGVSAAASGRSRQVPSQPAELLGPGGPDDPSSA